tara:strand:- start:991 stop:1272 length:282 start_codon:yes stop_codon:yes gene_type:complete
MFQMAQRFFTWSESMTADHLKSKAISLLQLKNFLIMQTENQLEVTEVKGELLELQREIKLMARYSTITGDMIMSMKVNALNKAFLRLQKRLLQ